MGNLFQSDAAAGCHLDSGSQNDADNAWFKALENSLKVFVFQAVFKTAVISRIIKKEEAQLPGWQ